jgi:hypothetical protein
VFGDDIGPGVTATLAVALGCVGTFAPVACVLLAVGSACRTAPGGRGCRALPARSGACSLDTLSFYYDEDGELQCECGEDAEEMDPGWDLGFV